VGEGVGQRGGVAGSGGALRAGRLGDLPRRWVVERTFSWLGQNRRMSKDYERLPESSEAFVYVAMSRLMVKRLARS
jgi:transposase